MAKINSKKYAVIRAQGEIPVLKKMGVKEECIFPIQRCNELMSQIQLGDTLCVASVKAFAVSAVDLCQKMQFLANKGVNFSSGNEKYLSFTSVQPISAVSLETLRDIAVREQEGVSDIMKCQIHNNLKSYIVSLIQRESMSDVVLIFRNKGVMKRGN